MALLLVSFVFSFLLYGSLEYVLCLIRYMQIVLHLPLMKTLIPANVLYMNKILIAIAMFDIFEPEWTTDYLYDYDEKKVEVFEELVIDQIKDIGYETPYVIKSMGSISIFTAFYLAKTCVFIVFYLLMKLTPLMYWKNGHKKLLNMSYGVFFSDLFAIMLDAYFEFSICCYYNLVFEIDPELI